MICMNYDHNKKFGLLKLHSGYGNFNLNSQKGYGLKINNAQTGVGRCRLAYIVRTYIDASYHFIQILLCACVINDLKMSMCLESGVTRYPCILMIKIYYYVID